MLTLALLTAGSSACSKSTPPPVETPESSLSLTSASESTTTRAVDATSLVSTNETASSEDTGASSETTTHASEPHAPELLDANGKPLPQTEDRPSLDSVSFKRRLELLVAAIADDQPDGALAAFFPQVAYAQVKAIKDPNRDWERRLVAAFTRNIREYHKQLGEDAQPLRFVRLEVPEAKIKWIKPGEEGNRLGYYRVTRSKLVVAKSSGQEVSLDLTSLISWRGEWYIVHLHGFE